MRPPIGGTGRPGTESSHGMTPVETLHLATFLASVYPSVRVRAEPSPGAWHALLADLDAADALLAVIRLARRQRVIALSDISAEAHRIREERLTRYPEPDADPDGPRHFRTRLPDVVAAMLSLRAPCSWCGAAPHQPCTLPGSATPLRRTLTHPARLIAVGPLLTHIPRGARHVR
jgi:hypothetical protein